MADTLIEPRHQRSALLAAELASQATGELLRFHREGPDGFSAFGDPEPVAVLAEALLRTARIEAASFDTRDRRNADYVSAVGQLAGACANFLDDQCNIVVLDDEPTVEDLVADNG